MSETTPLARGPIPPAPPVGVAYGWEVSLRTVSAPLTLRDLTPLGTVHVRAAPDRDVAASIAASHGRAVRWDDGTLACGFAPGEWLLVTAPDRSARVAAAVRDVATARDGLVTVVDVTHGRALLRLTGDAAAATLSLVCAVDLSDDVAPDGAALRTSVAGVVTDIVRDDRGGPSSYLLGCEWSSARYLHDELLRAGVGHGIAVAGFAG